MLRWHGRVVLGAGLCLFRGVACSPFDTRASQLVSHGLTDCSTLSEAGRTRHASEHKLKPPQTQAVY